MRVVAQLLLARNSKPINFPRKHRRNASLWFFSGGSWKNLVFQKRATTISARPRTPRKIARHDLSVLSIPTRFTEFTGNLCGREELCSHRISPRLIAREIFSHTAVCVSIISLIKIQWRKRGRRVLRNDWKFSNATRAREWIFHYYYS